VSIDTLLAACKDALLLKELRNNLTSPLLTTADGKKMGKTADGAVWLDETMLSPFDYFQYFRNTHDADVGKFLKLFTDLELSEIVELEKLQDQNINQAKEILAFAAVKICHGEKTANEVLQKAREIFVAKNTAAFEEKKISWGEEKTKKLVDIIFEIGAAESKGAAKKLIEGKAVKINGEVVLDGSYSIINNVNFDLSIGKKKFFKIMVS
jgi:tyrosyl-tRNA synthetase